MIISLCKKKNPNLIPLRLEGVEIVYNNIPKPFEACTNVKPVKVSATLQEEWQNFYKNESKELKKYDDQDLDLFWRHHRLYGIAFNEFEDCFTIFGPTELECSKPEKLNGKSCKYESLPHG